MEDIFSKIDKNIEKMELENSRLAQLIKTRDEEDKKTKTKVSKRAVGRPTNKQKIIFPEPKGIIEECENEMCYMMLRCRNISEFKKTILICRYYKCQEILINFKKDAIFFHIPNLDSRLNYFFKIDTTNSIMYYCKKEFSIIIDLNEFDSALNRINEDTDIIKIVQYTNLFNIRIEIGFERLSVNSEDVKVIDILSENNISFKNEEFDFSDYELQLQISSKELKNIITVVKDKTARCQFCKNAGEDRITLTFFVNDIQDRKITINDGEVKIKCEEGVSIISNLSCNYIRGMTIHSAANLIYLYFSSQADKPIIVEYKLPTGYIRLYISSEL